MQRSVYTILLITTVVFMIAMAIAILLMATQGDPTVLGDPYYEDHIIAHQRAFAPWAFTMLVISLCIPIALLELRNRR